MFYRHQFRYTAEGGIDRLIDVESDLPFDECLAIFQRSWDWRAERYGRKTKWLSLDKIIFATPTSKEYRILSELPPENLRPVQIKVHHVSGAYWNSAYHMGKDADEPIVALAMSRYDAFYLNRKSWRRKSPRHLRHILASMGFRPKSPWELDA